MVKSKFFTLSFRDFIRGSIVAVLTGIGTILAEILQTDGTVTFKKVILSSAIALIAYLVKNLFTNSRDQVLKNEI